MRRTEQSKKSRTGISMVMRRPTRRLVWMSAVVAVAGCTLVFAVRAYNRRTSDSIPAKSSTSPSATIGSTTSSAAQPPLSRRSFQSRLAFQPEANRIRRRLGQRFVASGREATVADGTLTRGGDRQSVRITRTQADEAGEQVVIAVGGGPASLTWNAGDGAKSNSAAPGASERKLIERIALDSPDQFILAQVRGANYYTIARAVMPAEAGGSESYAGPVWDLIRITEPQRATGSRPESEWRIFYINNSTGLIDKVLYQEQGETITVEFSGWASRGGELAPALTRWSRGAQVVMELSLNNVSYGSR